MTAQAVTAPSAPPAPTVPADVYAEVQHFYARQMRHLDAGEAEIWAGTFTEDGSFKPPSLPEPVRGRPALAEGARQAAAHLAAAGETHRHWVGMLTVTPADDGSLIAESQVTIIAVAQGGPARLHLVCACRDVLVAEDGELLVRERVVTRDDRP
ncbi:nuclear transport factor 2 family protein [Streptomyces sp. NBC_01275]|uniref:nuclear transport factor 2 family protein n=1 Tax=Streptomyces sp. NBC_01275 TaxID=2903807 RepID=UPI00224F2F1D|nr:nuclear transport factor 2 family protein [Streptomyces sp. NBC_01275]MCX4766665.1 nuclear transport factor 2 family protein [Streptomyces sp. NBC_01275]